VQAALECRLHVAQKYAGPALVKYQQLRDYVADAQVAQALQAAAINDEVGRCRLRLLG